MVEPGLLKVLAEPLRWRIVELLAVATCLGSLATNAPTTGATRRPCC